MSNLTLRWLCCLGGLALAIGIVAVSPQALLPRAVGMAIAFAIAGLAVGTTRRRHVVLIGLAAGAVAAILPPPAGTILGLLILLVLFAFFAILRWNTPYTSVEVHPGLKYRVGTVEHVMPVLPAIGRTPLLLRQPVFDELLEIGKYADGLLTRHGIEYAAAYGTVLGMLRHGGLIPWDDDVDFDLYEDKDNRRLEANFDAIAAEARRDGYVLSVHGPYWKLSRDNFWRYPVVDLYDTRGHKAPVPPGRIAWEDTSLCCPPDPAAYVEQEFGPKAMTSVVHNIPFWDSGFVPAMLTKLSGSGSKGKLDRLYWRLFAPRRAKTASNSFS